MTIQVGIALLAVIVAGVLIALVHRAGRVSLALTAAIVGALMATQLALAASGVLRDWSRIPPPFVPTMAVAILVAVFVAMSSVGRRIANTAPLSVLVGYQCFRLPLELVMHAAANAGVMPAQMSYSGWNFDILSGALAIPVAVLAATGRAPRWLVVGWNLMGTVLLANIVTIAVASTPLIAAFGPDRLNTWIADPPFIWLPGVLVPAALFGHILVWRRLGRPST